MQQTEQTGKPDIYFLVRQVRLQAGIISKSSKMPPSFREMSVHTEFYLPCLEKFGGKENNLGEKYWPVCKQK